MSMEQDTAIAIEYKKQLVNRYNNVTNCKECKYIKIENKSISCTLDYPDKKECNVLKIYM